MLVRTQILLPENLLHELRLLAARQGWSVSKTVRQIVKKHVPFPKKRLSNAEFIDRLLQNPYRGPVPKDFSTNDEYLYGKIRP